MSMTVEAKFEHEPISLEVIAYVEKYIELDANQKICNNYKYTILPVKVQKSTWGNEITEKVDWMVEESFDLVRSYQWP